MYNLAADRKNRFEILGDHKLFLMYRRPHELIVIYSAAPRSINSGWKFPVDFSDRLDQSPDPLDLGTCFILFRLG